MAGFSKSIYIGRLTRDPEVKQVTIRGEQTTVANFTVAVDKEVGEGADFYNIVAWRGLAETVGKFLTKGRLVLVEGRSQTRQYDVTKEGVTFQNYVSETHATKVEFLDRGAQGGQDAPAQAVAVGGGRAAQYQPPVTTDEEPW